MTIFYALFYKELLRFYKVLLQTVLAPVVTALLYLLIFSHVLSSHVQVYEGVHYTAFLVPGLVMMSVLQNAFANSSSSLIQSKITGNIVFVLLPPISYAQFFLAYVAAAIVRGMVVGLGVFLVAVVEILAPEVYEVEFTDEEGRAYASLALRADQLLALHYHPVAA